MAFQDETIQGFLDRVAHTSPTVPAGGSVAALAGALAASLGRFVAALSASQAEAQPGSGTRIAAMEARFTALQQRCLDLVEGDVEAYEALIQARRMSRGTLREKAVEAAWIGLLAPPLAVAKCGVEMLRLGLELIRKGYPVARADAGVAAEVAHGCTRAALWIALANLPQIRGEKTMAQQGDLLEVIRVETEHLFERLRDELD